MQRSIKFRAWDKIEKRICRVISISPNDDGTAALQTLFANFGLSAIVGDNYPKRFELMQYTGLHDRNRKEIYEGDIIEYREDKHSRVTCAVKWEKGGWTATNAQQGLANLRLSELWEVIGNIYENPGLLK